MVAPNEDDARIVWPKVGMWGEQRGDLGQPGSRPLPGLRIRPVDDVAGD